ncbi:MAG: SBBP repeat-containing protein [Verrucomicrobiota bacterium]
MKSILVGLNCLSALGLFALAAPAQTMTTPGNLPLYFEDNRGQTVGPAQFVAHGRDCQFLISPSESRLILCKTDAISGKISSCAVRMQFVNANAQAQIRGDAEQSGKINYLIGNDPARWRTGMATFAQVQVEQLYPGINLIYYGNQQRLEYDFTIAPHANPEQIAIRFAGVDKISVSPQGELILTIGKDEICQPKPLLYQTVNGSRKEISGGYKIVDAHTVTFDIGNYDHSLPLVIDPILSYSTYFGGNYGETAWSVAVNTNDGSIYMAGQTFSTQFTNWPVPPGAYQTNYHGGQYAGDAFIAKFGNLGTNLIYFTYLGGSGNDRATSIAVDNSGNAYVTGYTDSTNFPATGIRGLLTSTNISGTPDELGYSVDAFVAELNSSGSNLVYSAYLGGSGMDGGNGIALDSSNNVYVTGFTFSTNFPTTTNAFQKHIGVASGIWQPYFNGNAFVVEISTSGTNLLYSSYFGGTNCDEGEGIALDNSNCVYVTGFTASTNFPTTNWFQRYLNGWTNAFIAKFTPSCTNLVYSSFLGGMNRDVANGIAVDNQGAAYVTGWTTSTNFPNTVASLPNGLINNVNYGYNVTTNAFLTKITNGVQAAIAYSAVFGGTNLNTDIGYGVAVDPAGNAFVVGTTTSTNFPVTTNNIPDASGFLRATNSGGNDVFVMAFTNTPALLCSAYLGGSSADFGYGIAVDPADNAYVVGTTSSTNFPTLNAFQSSRNGTNDAFLAKIFLDPPILALSAKNGQIQVAWPSSPFEPELSRIFKLESNTNFMSPNWVLVAPQPTSNSYTITINPNNPMQFFRLHAF